MLLSFPPLTEFKAYMIMSLAETRSQIKALTRAVSETRTSKSSRSDSNTVSQQVLEFDEGDDPLFGYNPCLSLQSWEEFNSKLKENKQYAVEVVTYFILLNLFMFWCWFSILRFQSILLAWLVVGVTFSVSSASNK